ncbi:MAG TPA: hypothetical protein PLM16_00630, partial [Candidatus Woesebacteria bacterium]|nr:hypothetical protein [Candidatus Woesebacteria bacterium]
LLGALSLVNDPNQSDKAVNITDPTNIANEARKALIQLGERGVLEWQRQQEVISLYKLVQELDPTSLQTRIRTILAEDGQPSTDLQALEKFGDELARKIAVALQVNQLLSSLVRAIHPEVTAQLELQKAQSEATGHTGALTAFPENELVASYGREFQEAETDERKLIIAKPMRPSQFADLLRNPDSGFNLRALISYLKNPKLFFSLLNEETSRSENPNQKQQAETAKQIVLRHLAAGLDWLQSMRDRRLADYNPLLEELATTLGTDAITRHNFEQSYHTFE